MVDVHGGLASPPLHDPVDESGEGGFFLIVVVRPPVLEFGFAVYNVRGSPGVFETFICVRVALQIEVHVLW